MKKIQYIDPFFFTHPMNGLLGILLLLVFMPISSLFVAIVITYLFSIIGLLTINFFSDIKIQIDGIIVGTITIVIFSIISVVIELLLPLHYIGYQLLLLSIYIPVSTLSLFFLRDKGNGLSSMDELCHTTLQRQLLITEHKRINKRFIFLSFLTIIIIFPLLYRGYIDESCRMSCQKENVVGYLIALPFVLLYIFEIFRLWLLRNKLKEEVWLSLIDNNSREVGRISKDSICHYDGLYNLSLVRVIVFYKDYIYIECSSPNGCDTPFVGWLEQGQTEESQAIKIVEKDIENIGKCNLNKMFVYKTSFKNRVNTIVSLYCLRLKDMSSLNKKKPGKWWKLQDICDSINRPILCDMLDKELMYIDELSKF